MHILMAIASPSLPALCPLSTLLSQEKRRRRRRRRIQIQLKATCNSPLPPNPQPKIKRQNHLRKKLSNTKFSGDFSTNQSSTHLVVSHEIDNLGFSNGGVEKEGAKLLALQMHIEDNSNSQVMASQMVEPNQISSEIDECSRTNGMVSKEVHQLEGLVREEEGSDLFGAPTFGLTLRIGAIFLAQTLFAILFFGLGGFFKERREEKKKKKREKNVEGEVRERVVMDQLEYASKVTEVRAMASLVRQREKQDVEARERGSRYKKKGLDEDSTLNFDSSTDIGKKESDFGNGKGVNRLDEFGNEHVNVKTEEKLAVRSRKGVNCLNREEQGEKNSQEHNSNYGSTNQIKESKISFSKRADVNGNEEITGEEPWWYQLPYVLGIFLSGGENNSAPRGLYYLEMSPNSENGNSLSYAVTFQDRGDAENCCYLLDLFFEDLDDASAEVVPFTIQELKEMVQSSGLNVIVVPKGKLKLYAGQPLEEVEILLRSFVN